MLAIPILLFCCYGLYSSMSTNAVPLQHKDTYVQDRIVEKKPTQHIPKKKALIGNRVKDLCVNFFTSKKERKNLNKTKIKNADTPRLFANISNKEPETKTLSGASKYGMPKPIYNVPAKISLTAERSNKSSDEYLLSKYDVARLHKGDELIKWQSIKVASSKQDLNRYKAYVGKLHARRLSDNISDSIHKACQTILSVDQQFSFLSKENLYSVRQLQHTGNVDLNSGIKHLRYLDNLLSQVPVLIPQNLAVITSHFGKRKLHKKKARDHNGIDMTSPEAIIYASADGRVEFCGWAGGYGNLVIINHGKFTTKYAHLRKMCVAQGSFVTQGSKIAFEGATGAARGRHLHFEIRYFSGEAINPIDFISCSMQATQKSQSERVLAMQMSRYNKSLLSAVASGIDPVKGTTIRKNAARKHAYPGKVILAQNDLQKPFVSKKAALKRKVHSSKHLSKPSKANTVQARQADDLQHVNLKPEANEQSFFGKMYRAIVPW